MSNTPRPARKQRSISFYIFLGAALFASIQTFSLLSPILLSFLLVLLISLALNPVIARMHAFTGGRTIPTGLFAVGMITAFALLGWALFEPVKTSVTNLSAALPGYWERLQKPLIKMEQQAVLFEKKLQAEVSTEIAREEPAVVKPDIKPQITPPTPPPKSPED